MDYGAQVAGVRRLVPEQTISDTSRPSEADVREWLAEFDGKVARRLGNLGALTAAQVVDVELAARSLVHYATASTAWDAAHPERAGDERRYGAVLWARYTDGLDELAAQAEAYRLADPPLDVVGVPAGSFPAPAFPDDFPV